MLKSKNRKEQILYLNRYNTITGVVTMQTHLCYLLKQYVIWHGIYQKTDIHRERDFGFGINKINIGKDFLDYFDKPFITTIMPQYIKKDTEPIENSRGIFCNDQAIYLQHETGGLKNFKALLSKPEFNYCKYMKFIIPRYATFIKCKEIIKELGNNQEIECMLHPWYNYPKTKTEEEQEKEKVGSICIGRIDHPKHIDIIYDANDKLPQEKWIDHYGSKDSGIYAFHTLGIDRLDKYWKGRFPATFEDNTRLLSNKKFLINLTEFNGDGGGTEYSTLEGIYNDCCIILHRNWIRNAKNTLKDYPDELKQGMEFEEGYNCLCVDNSDELVEIINKNPDVDNLVKNSKKIIEYHEKNLNPKWIKVFQN